ncbi:MAG: (4Fe-4S)-binding protein [Deltaproteobacteria bacterium]|nr:MAG: (4Fe-4S)-binding protein [Deltaproteobacteria bacterium]
MTGLAVVSGALKQLVVISGKGGTGKTSVAAALAQLAGKAGPVVTADCDVEAANLALVMGGGDDTSEPFMAGQRAHVDPDRCIGCGLCVEHCRFEALSSDPIPTVDPLACEGCGVCALVCADDAVSFTENQAGWSLQRSTPVGPLVHAQLGVAQDSSGKLVASVRQRAKEVAEQEGIELVIVDGPPGIGCPVHAALTGCDLVLVVTEPTASGEHDLARVLELVAHFRMRAVVLINKYDLAPEVAERIAGLAERSAAPVVGRIPFDRAIARALAEGELPFHLPAFAAPLAEAWQAIRKSLRG